MTNGSANKWTVHFSKDHDANHICRNYSGERIVNVNIKMDGDKTVKIYAWH